MLAFLSPAKNMRPIMRAGVAITTPVYQAEADRLFEQLKAYSPWQLESLMKINPALALRAFDDFQASGDRKSTPAILSYYGLAYQHMDADSFDNETLLEANARLRILSACYGVLRPLDGIVPYRLEYACRFRPDQKTLYRWWGDKIHQNLFSSGQTVVNLASGEYAKSVLPFLRPRDRLIHCDFVLMRKGKLVALATESKMARGAMARFIVMNRVETPEELKAFSFHGYTFSQFRSSETRYVFEREL